MGQQAASGEQGTVKILVAIMVIILGLLAYSLYQGSVLEGQVQSLQLQNAELGLRIQSQDLNIELILAKFSTTASAPPSFEITSACVSVGQGCPPNGGALGAGYAYSFGLKDTGSAQLSSTLSVYLSFRDTRDQATFGFNSTLPGAIAPGSTAYLQAPAWPSFTNATSKLSPGDPVVVAITIGSVQNNIATVVLSCTSGTSTTTGNSTVTTSSTCT
jgi:hypothetical protein